MRLSSLRLAFLLACALLAGCGAKAIHELPGGPESIQKGIADAAPVALTTVDRAAYDNVVAKNRGKVVLVDFWATWCAPCVEQLPHTLEMGKWLGGRGLAVVTVSCDDPAESQKVAAFLGSTQAGHATNLISQFGSGPQTVEAFEITTGAVPFYKLYDRTGKLRHTFGILAASQKQFTLADIEAAVEQLLAE